jgi:serine/threonine protein kinase
MRQYFYDFTSASRYFYHLVEEHANPTDCDAQIIAVLGGNYDSRYRNLLYYIQPAYFLSIDAEVLGKGQNGAVYGAILRRPKPVLCATLALESSFEGPGLPVVLKRIKPKSGDSRRISAILREVRLSPGRKAVFIELTEFPKIDMTFTAIAGLSVHCVKLVGITSLAVDGHGRVLLPSQSPNSEVELFLIIERASEKNLLDFLERRLEGANEVESWNIIIDILCSIASGISILHDKRIIHGYVPACTCMH